MSSILSKWLILFCIYLLLVAGSGSGDTVWAQIISPEEAVAGIGLSLIVAVLAHRLLSGMAGQRVAASVNPFAGILSAILYCVPFFIALAKANIDVAYRVITCRIRPGLVRIRPGLKRAQARTLLANSITLTPGTLTVDVDDGSGDFLIHWINVTETKNDADRLRAVCANFPTWARRIAE